MQNEAKGYYTRYVFITFSDGLVVKDSDLRTRGRSEEYLNETSSISIFPLSGQCWGGLSFGGRVSRGASDSNLPYAIDPLSRYHVRKR